MSNVLNERLVLLEERLGVSSLRENIHQSFHHRLEIIHQKFDVVTKDLPDFKPCLLLLDDFKNLFDGNIGILAKLSTHILELEENRDILLKSMSSIQYISSNKELLCSIDLCDAESRLCRLCNEIKLLEPLILEHSNSLLDTLSAYDEAMSIMTNVSTTWDMIISEKLENAR